MEINIIIFHKIKGVLRKTLLYNILSWEWKGKYISAEKILYPYLSFSSYWEILLNQFSQIKENFYAYFIDFFLVSKGLIIENIWFRVSI